MRLTNKFSQLINCRPALRPTLILMNRLHHDSSMFTGVSSAKQLDEFRNCCLEADVRKVTAERDSLAGQLADAIDKSTSLFEELSTVRRELDQTRVELEGMVAEGDRRLGDAVVQLHEAEDDERKLKQNIAELKVERQASV